MFLFGEIESSDFEQTVPEFEDDHVFFCNFATQIVADDSVAVVDESSLDVGLLQEQPPVVQNFSAEIADNKSAVFCLLEAVFPR